MQITQAPSPAFFSLNWYDMQRLIGAPADSISDVKVDSIGNVVIKIDADHVEAAKKGIDQKFYPSLQPGMFHKEWVEEVDKVYLNDTCKIAAIRRIRELTNCGLVDGKNWVESWFTKDGNFLPWYGPIPF